MTEQLYPRIRPKKDLPVHRPWGVTYDLAYDGGGARWVGYYRTQAGARIAAWWNYHIASWGGSATLFKNEV